MQWIEGVERRNGALGVLVSDGAQAREWRPASDLNRLLPTATSSHRRRLTMELSDWGMSSARSYFDVLGLERDVGAGHTVFSFNDEGIEYLVPALIVVEALIRPLHYLGSWLLIPASLEFVATPHVEDDEFSALLTLRRIDERYLEAAAARQLFTWLLAFPSARNMWSSVYTKAARDGQLGIDLPRAKVSAVFRGHKLGNQVAVTAARVMELSPTEATDLDTPPRQTGFTLHDGSSFRPMARGDAEAQLLRRLAARSPAISDAQWALVEPLLQTSPRRFELDQRSLLQDVLTKLATGRPWRQQEYRTGDWRHASTAYRRWKIRGVWEEVCTRLLDSLENEPLVLETDARSHLPPNLVTSFHKTDRATD